jgi:hypothetical protein
MAREPINKPLQLSAGLNLHRVFFDCAELPAEDEYHNRIRAAVVGPVWKITREAGVCGGGVPVERNRRFILKAILFHLRSEWRR